MNEYYNESPNRNKSKLITVVFVAIAVLAATNIMTYILTKNLASSQGLNIKTDDTVAREYINKMLFIRDQINRNFYGTSKKKTFG
jgi:Tfp pilus assembly protein PilV